MLMDVAGGESVPEVTSSDVSQDRLGGGQFGLVGRTIDAPSMTLEIVGECEGLEQWILGNRPLAGVREMIDQRQRRHELAILREMTLKGGREFAGTQLPFQVCPPVEEVLLAPLVEAQSRHLVIRPFLGAELERCVEVDLGGLFKHLPRGLARLGVRVLVNVAPFAGRVGPNHEAKTLNESVAASAAVIGAADVFADPCGLSIAENRNARGLDMAMSAHDPVEGIGRRA